eukprot:TRINITY_DN3499_c0_g1_i1.p1 TRINITY_DN3499_c0_g1~~TRINITY_DN3499_c0_g1_i1.p1  ORF type:complete len:1879 (+),score=453.35 TRINITY_DN3499_c0_g1_i1:58-5637(+)
MAVPGRCAAVASVLTQRLVPRLRAQCTADGFSGQGGFAHCLPDWPPLFDIPDDLPMPPAAAMGTLVPGRTEETAKAQGLSDEWLQAGRRVLADAQRLVAEIEAYTHSTGGGHTAYVYDYDSAQADLSWDAALLTGFSPPQSWGCAKQLDWAGGLHGVALACGEWCALLPPVCGGAAPAPVPSPTPTPSASEVCGNWVTAGVALKWTETEYWGWSCGGAEPCCAADGLCLTSPGYQSGTPRDQWCWAYPKLYDTDTIAHEWDSGGGALTEWRGRLSRSLWTAATFEKRQNGSAQPELIEGRLTDWRADKLDWPLLEWRPRPGGAARWRLCLVVYGSTDCTVAKDAKPQGPPPASPAAASMTLSGIPLPPQPPADFPPPPRADPVPGAGLRPLQSAYADWAGTRWGYDGAACGRLDPFTAVAVTENSWCAMRGSGAVEGCWYRDGEPIAVPPAVLSPRALTVYGSLNGGFVAVSGGRVRSWWGSDGGALPAEAAAVSGIATVAATTQAFVAVTSDGRVAAAWGFEEDGGHLPLHIRQLRGVAAVAATRYAFAALLRDGSIGGAWGELASGGSLPHALRCARGVVGLAAARHAFAALSSNGSLAGCWGKVYKVPLLRGTAAITAGADDFVALASSGRVTAQWGLSGTTPLPAAIAAARGVAAVVATTGETFALLLADGRIGGMWTRRLGLGHPALHVQTTRWALVGGGASGFVLVDSEGSALFLNGSESAPLPHDRALRLAAAPVWKAPDTTRTGVDAAIRSSGSFATVSHYFWWLDPLPKQAAARFRLLGEPCAPPLRAPGTDHGDCACVPPGWRCTVRRSRTWRALQPSDWDDWAASRVDILCPENNTSPLAPMVRAAGGADFAGVSVEPYNCSGGPQAGVDDRALNYAECNELRSGDYCALQCAEGWAAVNATASSGASLLMECMPYPTAEGGFHYVNGYDASGARCERLVHASATRVVNRAGFEAIALPLRPALSFETVSSSGSRLPAPPLTDCFLCDCSAPDAEPPQQGPPNGSAPAAGCGGCPLLDNTTAEYDQNLRGSCALVAKGIAPGSDYPELVAVVAFRRPLQERDEAAFGHLPALSSPVRPGDPCLPSQVLLLAPGSSRCGECPPQLLCDGSNATGTRAGWWRPGKRVHNASRCVTPHCATAPVGAPQPRCAHGSRGPLCGSCTERYRIAAGACRACGNIWADALATLAGAVAGCAFTVLYLFANATVWLESTAFRDIMQLTLSHLQFLSLLPYFLGPIYGAVTNTLFNGLKQSMAPLAGAAPLLCLLPPSVGQLEAAWAAVALLWVAPVGAGLLAAAALPPLLRRRLRWRLRRAAGAGGGRVEGAQCSRCGACGHGEGCRCDVLAVCPCGAEWATRRCSSCGGPWICEGCAGLCSSAHPEALAEGDLRRTGPMHLGPRTLFWLGANLGTNFLLPHSVSVIAAGFQLVSYDEPTAEGWLARRTVLAADARVEYDRRGGVFALFAFLIAAAVLPMLAVYGRVWRIARGDGLGSDHAVLAYGVFYAPYRRHYYWWGVVPFVLKVVAAAASTLIEEALHKAVFGVVLHSAQLLAECFCQPEMDQHLTWVTGGTMLLTMAGGQWLLMGGDTLDAVIVRVVISVNNLWCFWELFRALRAAAPPLSLRRCPCSATGAAAAAAAAAATTASPRTRAEAPPPRPPPSARRCELRRAQAMLRGLPQTALPEVTAALQQLARSAPSRRRRALHAVCAALQQGASGPPQRPGSGAAGTPRIAPRTQGSPPAPRPPQLPLLGCGAAPLRPGPLLGAAPQPAQTPQLGPASPQRGAPRAQSLLSPQGAAARALAPPRQRHSTVAAAGPAPLQLSLRLRPPQQQQQPPGRAVGSSLSDTDEQPLH